MKNGLSFDIEDWFQVENLRSLFPHESWDGVELRVEVGTTRILEALAQSGQKATFFILGWIAERRPELVRRIAEAGHEIASHGYGHELVYKMAPESFRSDLRRSKQLLEDISGCAVRGYRAPSFSITRESLWAIDVLREEGFSYDSSVFPTSFHDRYGLEDYGASPYQWPNGLWEIPMAVAEVRGYRLPVAGGGYFRLFPYALSRRLLSGINTSGRPFAFYLHPWELDPDQPRVRTSRWLSFRHYVNLESTRRKLHRLLHDFEFTSIDQAFGISPL